MRKTLIIGATSAIAEACARRFAEAGDALCLVARDPNKLAVIAADLEVRGACAVHHQTLDVLIYDQHASVIATATEQLEGLDLVVLAHGDLPDQRACETSFDLARHSFEVNALSTMSLLTHLANQLEAQGSGTIVAISSVAGDRGRQSNYLYGSAKGGLSLFLGGLRNRLYQSGVRVITVKPGFVDTPMTAEFTKGALWASPGRVARDIDRAILRGADTVYTPGFWRLIMWVIRLIPERLFKRLSL
jgi:short-subunit dehydrogenase